MSKWAALAAVAVLLVSGGCDSNQPLDADGGTAALTITTSQSADLDVFDMWDIYQDTDGDGVGDTNIHVPWCEQVLDNGSPMRQGGRVPWRVAVEVQVIRAGATAPEPDEVFTETENWTPYDSSEEPLGDKDLSAAGLPGYWGLNGKQVTSANRDFLEKCLHIKNLPTEQLLGGSQPFTLDVNKGDTIVVKARTDTDVTANPVPGLEQIDSFPGGLKPGPIQMLTWHDPDLAGHLTINGRTVAPAGKTEGEYEGNSGGWISFSYTLR